MKTRGLFGIGLAVTIGVASACGGDDDSDGSGGSGGTTSSGGSAGSGTAGSGGSGTSGSGGMVAGDACQNPADQTALEADYGDGGVDECGEPRDVAAIAKGCGIDCITSPDQETCVKDCILKEAALSDGCVGCVIQSFFCGRDNCTTVCLSTPCAECDDCLCGNNDNQINCLDAYDACSGQKNTVCP